jgi:hypothetical protein
LEASSFTASTTSLAPASPIPAPAACTATAARSRYSDPAANSSSSSSPPPAGSPPAPGASRALAAMRYALPRDARLTQPGHPSRHVPQEERQIGAVALGQPWGDLVAGLAVTAFICHVGYQVTADVARCLADGVDPVVITTAEAVAGSVPGVIHAYARARWTGRTLRLPVNWSCCV